MKLKYLPSAVQDLIWFKKYYSSVFAEGVKKAQESFKEVEKIILEHPHIGVNTENDGIMDFKIINTPFSFQYRIKGDYIRILRVFDNRRP